tara:strand:+ start:1121 stop:1288 length:168 start_codon:yes stop_codon:yes gene_type:complete
MDWILDILAEIESEKEKNPDVGPVPLHIDLEFPIFELPDEKEDKKEEKRVIIIDI